MAERNYPGPPLITMDLPAIEVKLAEANLENVHAAMIQRMVDWATAVGIDVLETALPRVPYDTGQLRESGTVTMDLGGKTIDIATGRREDPGIRYLPGMAKLTPQLAKKLRKRITTIASVIHFHRIADSNEGPRDIALWTHEDLNPYGSGVAPSATKPLTGPKYLESAFREKAAKWNAMIPAVEQQMNRDQKNMGVIQTTNLKGHIFKKLTMKLRKLKKFVFFKRGR